MWRAFLGFPDRGNLLSAARVLFSQYYGLLLSIKYCLDHIIHKVTAKYGLKRTELPKLRSLIQECQASHTIAHFHFAIEKVFLFPPSNSEPLLG
jgi:hypothetical protein